MNWVPLSQMALEDLRHDGLHWLALAMAAALIALTPLVEGHSMAAGTRAVWALGLFGQWGIISLLSIVIGSRILGVPLRDGTVALWLGRHLSVIEWVLVRAFVAYSAIIAVAAACGLAWAAAVGLQGATPLQGWLWSVPMACLEGFVIASIAMALSTRMTPLWASLLTGALWFAGHLASEYQQLSEELGISWAGRLLFTLVPNLDLLDTHGLLIAGVPLEPTALAIKVVYATLWTIGLLALTVALMQRRDLV